MIRLYAYADMLVLAEQDGVVRLMGLLPDGSWNYGPTISQFAIMVTIEQNRLIPVLPYNNPREFADIAALEDFLFAEYPKQLEQHFPGISKKMTPDDVREMWGKKKQ